MASSMVVVVLESFQKKLALFLSFDPHCLYTYYTISFLVLLLATFEPFRPSLLFKFSHLVYLIIYIHKKIRPNL